MESQCILVLYRLAEEIVQEMYQELNSACSICDRCDAERNGDFVVREDLLEFIPVYDAAAGSSLANIIAETFRQRRFALQ
jgi:hypothetical protein